MSDIQFPALKSAINLRLDIGRATLTGAEVMAAIQVDPALGLLVLQQWENRGWLCIDKDPRAAKPDEICVVVLSYVDGDKPWSDPMSGKM